MDRKKSTDTNPTLTIRNPDISDIPAILELTERVYPGMSNYKHDMIRGHIIQFKRGTFVAVYEGKVVGYCVSFRISGDVALSYHTWKSITGNGYASLHDSSGDYLYGMEVCVDPEARGKRIGQRFYNERKKLCQYLRLKGIVFAGRIPGLKKKIKSGKVKDAQDYVDQVQAKKIRDTVLSFQIRNGFEVLGLIKNYLIADEESMGYAVHLVWKNPKVSPQSKENKAHHSRMQDTIRIASVQYRQRQISSFDEFKKHIEYFVDVVSDYGSDFVLFPEMLTLQLLSMEKETVQPSESINYLTTFTGKFKEFMNGLAVKYNINIIGGSHPTMMEDGDIHNVCYVFLRDGSIHQQEKIHPTPNERYWWNIKGGQELSTIMTDCGPIGVLICYDSEFPELARHLADQGVQIIFVPFCTDERQSYLRVRYCSQSRAVENQCYVVLSGNVGNLPNVANMDIQYAQSCILTPCDFPFARDGIAADTTPNVEMVAVADVRPEDLRVARNSGTVQNLKDRRHDLYSVSWHPHLSF